MRVEPAGVVKVLAWTALVVLALLAWLAFVKVLVHFLVWGMTA